VWVWSGMRKEVGTEWHFGVVCVVQRLRGSRRSGSVCMCMWVVKVVRCRRVK